MQPDDERREEAYFWFVLKAFEDLYAEQPDVVVASLDRGVLSLLVDAGITRLRN